MIVILKRQGCTNGAPELVATALQAIRGEEVRVVKADYTEGGETLIRWGCISRMGGFDRVLNTAKDIRMLADKGGWRYSMRCRGLSYLIAPTACDVGVYESKGYGYPAIIRPSHHSGGRDFHVVEDSDQARLVASALGTSYYIQRKVTVIAEYRVMYVFGAVVQVVKRTGIQDGPNNRCNVTNIRWSEHPQWVAKLEPLLRDSHFGAVDVLQTDTGRIYVSEVNTAPEMYEYGAKCLARGLDHYLNHCDPLDNGYTDRNTRHGLLHPGLYQDS